MASSITMGRSLLNLPCELLFLIAECCVDRLESDDEILLDTARGDDLSSILRLYRSCKYLRTICVPALFRRVVLDDSGIGLLSLTSALLSEPHAHEHVQHLSLPAPRWSRSAVKSRKVFYDNLRTRWAIEPAAFFAEYGPENTFYDTLPFLVLRTLSNLQSLAVSSRIFTMGKDWSRDMRLVGPLLQRLRFIDPRIEQLRWPLALPDAFQGGQAPTALRSLSLYLPYVPASLFGSTRWLDAEWQSIFNSLQHLALEVCDRQEALAALSHILQATPRLTHLRLLSNVKEELSIRDTIATLSGLAAQLQYLEISTSSTVDDAAQDTGPFLPLTHFTNLVSLNIPMVEVLPGHNPAKPWPPILETLTLSWDHLPDVDFTRMVIDSLMTNQFPHTLKFITLQWETTSYLYNVHLEEHAVLTLLHLLRSLKEACVYCGIVLTHNQGRYPNARPRDGTLEDIAEKDIMSRLGEPSDERGKEVWDEARSFMHAPWEVVQQRWAIRQAQHQEAEDESEAMSDWLNDYESEEGMSEGSGV